MSDREVMQQALEALLLPTMKTQQMLIQRDEAIIALRRALEQQQAEPVCPDCKAAVLYECVACSSNNYPPQRKPLTDEAIEQAQRDVWRSLPSDFDYTTSSWIEIGIRYAEAAHGIKEGT